MKASIIRVSIIRIEYHVRTSTATTTTLQWQHYKISSQDVVYNRLLIETIFYESLFIKITKLYPY